MSRRGHGEGTIYWVASRKEYCGELSLGYRPDGSRNRPKVYGKTKAAVRAKFKALREEHERGVNAQNKNTVSDAVNGFIDFEESMGGKADTTIKNWRHYRNAHIIPSLGPTPLRGKKALDREMVRRWLIAKAPVLSTSMLKQILSLLRRSIDWAIERKWVGANVTEGVKAPEGREGKPRSSADFYQLGELFRVARHETHGSWIWPYLALCVMTGIRAEEVRRLEWGDLKLMAETLPDGSVMPPHVRITKSVRQSGRTKTAKSYRAVELPAPIVPVLLEWKQKQMVNRERRGFKHVGIKLVFGTRNDTELNRVHARDRLYRLCDKAGVPRLRPSETRNTFVSVMSALGGSEELIADICGHSTPTVTRTVYRDDLRPIIRGGASLIGDWFTDVRANKRAKDPTSLTAETPYILEEPS